jgi:hypothetical protein
MGSEYPNGGGGDIPRVFPRRGDSPRTFAPLFIGVGGGGGFCDTASCEV